MNVPVKYKDVLVGYTDQSCSSVMFLKDLPQELIDLMHGNKPVSISSRKIGEIDENGSTRNVKPTEMIIMEMDHVPDNIERDNEIDYKGYSDIPEEK